MAGRSKLDGLLEGVAEPRLRDALEQEFERLKDQADFGLVFERHLPETVIVGDTDHLKIGDHVRPKLSVDVDEDFRVVGVGARSATVLSLKTGEQSKVAIKELLAIKRFGDPAHVGLEPLGEMRRSETRPYHAVINGENFHALQLLSFMYQGQVDCIYIDPPYNTGARDWTYNNDYVDDRDRYRHSKWLSFIEKRLQIAKRLLRPDGLLVITIDEHEVHHLGVLLEEVFPSHARQMATVVINPKGVTQGGLSRVEEYAFFVYPEGQAMETRGDDLLTPIKQSSANGADAAVPARESMPRVRWQGLLHSGEGARRRDRPNMFYPVLIDEDRRAVIGAGEPLLPIDRGGGTLEWPEPDLQAPIDGHTTVWPVRSDGSWGRWYLGHRTLRELASIGYVSLGRHDPKRQTWAMSYLYRSLRQQIEDGAIEVVDYDAQRNVVKVAYSSSPVRRIKTVWHRSRHDAGAYGADLLGDFLGARIFAFPKSLYAVRDTLAAVTARRPQALIVDFFAGSGTTLHATCLLNREDGGSRRCILVTNNEVGVEETRRLSSEGLRRGDPGFERHGIFEAVTRPRVEAAISGRRADGTPVAGTYIGGDRYEDGFEENVEFFRLAYLDRDDVELGGELDAIHPVLWLTAGARHRRKRPGPRTRYLIDSQCGYAVLLQDTAFREFKQRLGESAEISHVFLITDSDDAFAEMRAELEPSLITVHLYRDFLRHFRRRAPL